MAKVTKKARFRELFTETFDSGKDETIKFKKKVNNKIEKERHLN